MYGKFGHIYHFVIFCAAYRAERLFSLVSEVFLNFSIFFSLQESRETCARCGRAIMEATLKALGQVYHPNCFVCSMCPQSLEGTEFFVTEDNKPMCKDDFARWVNRVVNKKMPFKT